MSVYIFCIIAEWGYVGVGPYMLIKMKHVDTIFAGGVVATAFGVSPLLSPVLGHLADRIGRKVVIVALALASTVCIYVMFVSPVTFKPLLLVSAFLTGVGLFTIYWLGYTVVQDAVPSRFVGFATGMTGGCGYFAASFAGWVLGVMTKHFGYPAAVWVVIIGCQFLVIPCALF
ncbi:MAG: MFS transporter [Acidobacteriaceae bacterium]